MNQFITSCLFITAYTSGVDAFAPLSIRISQQYANSAVSTGFSTSTAQNRFVKNSD